MIAVISFFWEVITFTWLAMNSAISRMMTTCAPMANAVDAALRLVAIRSGTAMGLDCSTRGGSFGAKKASRTLEIREANTPCSLISPLRCTISSPVRCAGAARSGSTWWVGGGGSVSISGIGRNRSRRDLLFSSTAQAANAVFKLPKGA